jgi:hypothetical protein
LSNASQHIITLLQRSIEILEGREAGGTANDTDDEGGLAQSELRGVLSKIDLTGALDAVETIAEKNAIHVVIEDLILGAVFFDATRQHHLEKLSVKGAVVEIRVAVPRELHGDGARALHDAAIFEISHHGTDDAREVDAAMFVKAGIFTCEQRFDEVRRHLIERHDDAVLSVHASDELAFEIQHHGALRHLSEAGEVILLGQLTVHTDDDSTDDHSEHRHTDECADEHTPPPAGPQLVRVCRPLMWRWFGFASHGWIKRS